MSRPPFMHSNFFSSLKQVEKRLKLEGPASTGPISVPQMPPVHPSPSLQGFTVTESLSSPIYILNQDQQAKPSPTLQDSEPPREFLSISQEFSMTQENFPPQTQSFQNQPDIGDKAEEGVDDIELLIQLLHLSDFGEEAAGPKMLARVTYKLKGDEHDSQQCDNEFYGRVVGVEGPKCQTEVKRLDAWIRHFQNSSGEQRLEPLRLAHLLLAKASCVSADGDGTDGLEFPSTIQDFLLADPPGNLEKK